MPNSLLIESQYLPSVAYFSLLSKHQHLVLEAHENFEKQTYRNRCQLLSSQGIETLSVPLNGANKKIKTKEITINNDQNWHLKHWRSIKTCYGKAPFFEFFADEFEAIITKRNKFLWDLNLELLTKCLQIMRLKVELTESDRFEKNISDNVIDARSLVHPKKPELLNNFFHATDYYQSFGKNFETNLSIIDLLMNEGPNSNNVVQQSIINN